MAAFDFPNTPSNGQTYSANGIDWIYDGSVWKKDATAGVKGQKGEIGQKGQKGEIGEKGAKGDKGDKGQKGEIGATGGTGGAGSDGDKGQKGEAGVNATGTKGQKGEKGEIGPQGGTGGTGNKGEPGSGGSDGSDGDKGQKGEVGSSGTDAQLPIGTIVAYGGNSAPSGWQICNGGTASSSALQTLLGQSNVPDLRDRFIIGAGNNYSRHNTGGSKDATLVSHSHTINNHTHSFSSTHSHTFSSSTNNTGSHTHNLLYNHGAFGGSSGAVTPRSGNTPVTPGISGRVSTEGGHAHSFSGTTAGGTASGTTGNPSNTGTNSQGSSATNANLPPYYALIYIIKT